MSSYQGDILDGLGKGWLLLRNCELCGGEAAPARIDIVLLHPALGVALLERPPGWTADAPARLLRRLERARFSAIFPGTLPVVHLPLRRPDLARLPQLLAEAFATRPALALAGGDAWMSAVRRALQAGGGAGAVHDLAPEPRSGRRRATSGPASRRGPAVAVTFSVMLAGTVAVLTWPRPDAMQTAGTTEAATVPGVAAKLGALTPWSVAEAADSRDSQVGEPVQLAAAEQPSGADDAAQPDPGPEPWAAAVLPVPAVAAPDWQSPARLTPIRPDDVLVTDGLLVPPLPSTMPHPALTLANLLLPAPAPLPAMPPQAEPTPHQMEPLAVAPPVAVAAPVEAMPHAVEPAFPSRLVAAPPAQAPVVSHLPMPSQAPVLMPSPAALPLAPPPALPDLALPPIPPAAMAPTRGDPTLLAMLVRRGDALLAIGDVSAARRFYERAADAGSAEAAEAVGRTYDPAALQALGTRGLRADPEAAAFWRHRAASLRLQDRGAGR